MAQVETELLQIVTFRLVSKKTNEMYAIPIKQVREIRLVESITDIPNTKQHIRGIMNLRGKIIPVIDVKGKLGMDSESNPTEKQRILIVEKDDFVAGLLVDEVDQVLSIQKQNIDNVSSGMLDSVSHAGIVKINDKMLILIDAANFVDVVDCSIN